MCEAVVGGDDDGVETDSKVEVVLGPDAGASLRGSSKSRSLGPSIGRRWWGL